MDRDLAMQAFFLQDPDSERLVTVERHLKLLLERQKIGRVDGLILLLNPLLVGALVFILNVIYEGGKNVAVWVLGIPVIDLFIIFAYVFGVALLGSYLLYLVAYLRDSLAGRIRASGSLFVSILYLVVAEASISLYWKFIGVFTALGWPVLWIMFAVVSLVVLAYRTMFRFETWLTHWYEKVAPLTTVDNRPSLGKLLNSNINSGRYWGFLGRSLWWGSCVLYGASTVYYVFELAFHGFPLPFAVNVHLSKEVLYNIGGLLLMVPTGLVVKWKMKRWRVEGRWWAVD
jgi:hypothetical protein